ncbi:MAG: heterocyst frequency control protein PatD [Phormidium sp. BM_Day4_Bin.17]|nr:heterocyst frequency control protein PatD [Phormidium sp. BM_Day4_Bin.17]UCJ11640.1 MAG: heterocyst frequency control protein PatD [Phormidium sp. PBR-2020]
MSTNPYLELQERLRRLETPEANPPLTVQVSNLQQWFQQTLLSPESDRPQSEQSLLVELHKQLRLLATDAAFLQSAKTPQTQQQRQQQMGDRLSTLQRYCNYLLNPEDKT